ncbi:MAG: potassium uptake protein, TrkH family [Oscillospiraceae bacterium]|nr:potassium uptake protein, TrkH family [Oscillospiraceae bacterium]
MTLRARWYAFWLKKHPRNLSPAKIIAIVFAVIILLGAVLLSLPAASRSGVSCGFRPALFTATSATCVTGLVLYDTWSQWSGFGQIVIISLIQIGGLGFMSAATLFVFFLRKRIGFKQRLVMAQALSVSDMDGIVKLQKTVLAGSFAIEGIGALILFFRFLPEYGVANSLKWGLFHAISAFCNAGFDIFGCITPGASLMEFQSDPVVLLTLGTLVILGGLGFLVWQEVAEKRSFSKFGVYTKLVLVTTLALILVGWILTCLLEWDNPGTLGGLSVPDKLLNGLFQSITLRTAGFASIDQALLTEGGKAASMVIMLIGGSSGSTAGGLKTVTFIVLCLFLWARARGRETVCVYKRTIPQGQVLDAMTIAVILIALAMFGGIFISATSPVGFTDALYESVSALATVGLTAGATGSLSIPAQILIMIYMYFGRVGVLTISMGFLMGDRAEERFRYAETKLLIG